MFTGTYENSIDNKNRMIVPSKYRNQLGGKCMLARGFDREELVAKMRKLRQTDRDMRRFIREFFSNASECQLDSQGRILIPQNLNTYASITKDLITLGAMDKIEVWSKEVYNDSESENMFNDEEFIAKLEEYDI